MSENLRVNTGIWGGKFTSNYRRETFHRETYREEERLIKAIYTEWTFRIYSIVKFMENQNEHLSKLTLYHLKKRATRRSRRARGPSRIPLLFLRVTTTRIASMLKQLRYRSLQSSIAMLIRWENFIMHDISVITKIINLNKMALPKKAYLLSFLAGIITR